MKDIIAREIAKLKREIEKFFEEDEIGLDTAEEYFVHRIGETVRGLLTACYEQKDAQLLADKTARREAGLAVERRGDTRQVVTQLGIVSYRRTYYACREGGYCYPIDNVVGLESYQRVSNGVGLGLVDAAREMSYVRASRVVTGGLVTKQTVMRKIREAAPAAASVVRKKVAVLHVDADEDHVKLQSGDSRIVPLVSVYEGIEKNGKRGICKNVFHCSEFGKKTEDLWEEVLTEMERRYDLTDTKIYLHGDGAPWIKAGLEWLPNSRFVLDRYHVNKALKSAVSGIERKSGCKQFVKESGGRLTFSGRSGNMISETRSCFQRKNFPLLSLTIIQQNGRPVAVRFVCLRWKKFEKERPAHQRDALVFSQAGRGCVRR